MRKTTAKASPNAIDILARVLANGEGQMPADIARYIVGLDFSEQDKARMHDLAVRNQDGALSPSEEEELFAYARADTLLSILQIKARSALGVKPKKRAAT
jgi:hypothetical protein